MSVAVIASIGLLLAAVFLFAVLRLFAPARQSHPSSETNWEQRLSDDYPSLEGADEAPFDNVERGFDIALGRGTRN